VVETADNGERAVAMALSGHYDVVLMDVQMPVMDGYAATRIIRGELGRVDLPIIAVTAFARPEDRENSRRAGMVGHLVKPIDVEDLLDLVARERQGSQRPAARPVAMAPSPLPAWQLPGLNVTAALQAFGGDQKKYLEILRKFVARHGGDADAARRLFEADDAAGAGALLHGLGGMAALLQATELAHLAAAAETALRDGESGEMPFLFEGMDAAMRTLGRSVDQLDALWTAA
jgi:CheY-like chemotaxis protein